jgi:hypothetical protein
VHGAQEWLVPVCVDLGSRLRDWIFVRVVSAQEGEKLGVAAKLIAEVYDRARRPQLAKRLAAALGALVVGGPRGTVVYFHDQLRSHTQLFALLRRNDSHENPIAQPTPQVHTDRHKPLLSTMHVTNPPLSSNTMKMLSSANLCNIILIKMG